MQREFKHAYRELPASQQQGYLHELRLVADFDTERIKRYQEDYEQNHYALKFLVSDVNEFLFPAWDRMQTVFNQVSPLFWSWLRACIAIRKGEARALLVALGESLTKPAPTAAPSAGTTGTKPKPAAMPVAFDHYIKEEYREKLLPFLAREYAGEKPQEIAFMLIALKDLAALTYPLQSNVTVLHAALDAFLKGAGTRQSLADNLTKLNKASQKEHIKIQTHCARIKTYMEQG